MGDAFTYVALSNGESFYVAAELEAVAAFLNHRGLRRLGGRFVNPAQVVQLTYARDVPTIYTPERLEVPA